MNVKSKIFYPRALNKIEQPITTKINEDVIINNSSSNNLKKRFQIAIQPNRISTLTIHICKIER